MDKCFCHLNGYEVKDAKARRCVEGLQSMGNIRVGSIEGKNLFNKELYIASTENGYVLDKLEVGKRYTISVNNNPDNVKYGFLIKTTSGDTATSDMWEGYTTNNTTFTYTQAMRDNNYKLYVISLPSYAIVSKTEIDSINIQLEVGTVATEYAPYFELVTKDDLSNVSTGSSEGYYYFDIPIKKLTFSSYGYYNNEITDVDTFTATKTMIEKIVKDGVEHPHIIINNSLKTYVDADTGETIDLPAPRYINLISYTSQEIEGSNGVIHYSFNGYGNDFGHEEVDDYTLPRRDSFQIGVDVLWHGEAASILAMGIAVQGDYLITKRYADNKLGSYGAAAPGESDNSNYPVITFSQTAPNNNSNISITDDTKTQLEALINEYNGKELCVHLFDTYGYLGFGRKVIDGSSTVIGFGDMFRNEYISSWGYHIVQHSVMCVGTWTDGVFTCSEVKISGTRRWGESSYLGRENTDTYTPTANYHPATKKYVDDMIAALRNELQG